MKGIEDPAFTGTGSRKRLKKEKYTPPGGIQIGLPLRDERKCSKERKARRVSFSGFCPSFSGI